MASLEDMPNSEATLSANVSYETFESIFAKKDWRLYDSRKNKETLSMTNRFLSSHCQMPGGFSDVLLGVIPIEVLRFNIGNVLFEGFLFLNGAVIQYGEDAKDIFLFVEEATAKMWGYSDDNIKMEDRVSNE